MAIDRHAPIDFFEKILGDLLCILCSGVSLKCTRLFDSDVIDRLKSKPLGTNKDSYVQSGQEAITLTCMRCAQEDCHTVYRSVFSKNAVFNITEIALVVQFNPITYSDIH